MAGALADAHVEVTAEVDRAINARMRAAAKEAGGEYERGLRESMTKAAEGATRDANGKLRDSKGKFIASGANAGRSWGDAFREHMQNALARIGVAQVLSPLRLLKGLTAGIGLAVVGAQAAAAAAGLLQFLAAAAPAAGVLLALPAAAVVGAAGLLTLKVALSGMNEAFKAAWENDPKKFAEALKDLSPAARAVATEFRDMRPELVSIREATQEAFFGPLQGQLEAMGATLIGPVRAGMAAVAGEAGLVARALTEVAAQSETGRVLEQVFATTADSMGLMGPAVTALVVGLRDVVGAVLPIITQMSGGFAAMITQFGAWLSAVSASGSAFAWVQNALAVLGQLGDLFTQIGGIIAAVFSAAQTTSGGLLGTLTEVLRSVNAFLSSAQGMQILVSLFTVLNAVGAALGPVILALLGGLGQIAPVAAELAIALGPILTTALSALAPALAALGPGLMAVVEGLGSGVAALGPALLPLGQVLGELLGSLAPLLGPIGQLAGLIAGLLANSVRSLMPLLTPLVQILSTTLTSVLTSLTPSLMRIGESFGQLLTAIMPILGPILQFAGILIELLATHALVPLIGMFADAVSFLAGVITGAIGGVVDFVGWIGRLASSMGSGFSDAITAVGEFFSSLGNWFAELPGRAAGWLSEFGSAVGEFFASLPGLALAGLAGLGELLLNLIVGAFRLLLMGIGAGIALVIQAIIVLPGLIVDGLAALGTMLWDAMTAAWQWAVNASIAAGTALIEFALNLPSMIVNGIVSLGAMLAQFFTDAWNSAVQSTVDGINSLIAFALSLPGRIGGALSSLGSIIGGAFQSAWSNAVSIVSQGVRSVLSFIEGLPGQIVAFGGRMYDAGVQLIQSVVRGLQNFGSFVSGLGRSLLNFVIGGINSGLAAAWFLPGSPPQIPLLAQGAIVDRPTLAIIAEAGREVVIPLERPRRAAELARDSGLLDVLAAQGVLGRADAGATSSVVHNHNNTFNLDIPYADPELAAAATVDRLLRAAAV